MKKHLSNTVLTSVLSILIIQFSHAQKSLNPPVPDVYYQLENSFNIKDYKSCLALEKEVVNTFGNRMDTLATNSLSYLADSYYFEGDLDKAIDLYEKQLVINEKMEGNSSIAYGETLANIASTEAENGDAARAISLYTELMPLDKKNYGINSLEYVQTVNELGKVYISKRDYAHAQSVYEQLLKEVARDNISYPIVLNNLADLYIVKGEYSEAKRILGRALEAVEHNEGKENQYFAATLYNLSRLYYSRGEYAESELMNLESIKVINKIGKEKNLELYTANINQLGVTYTYMGLYPEAEKYLLELQQIDIAHNEEDNPNYAITLNNLANLYMFKGTIDRAEEYYKKSMEINKKYFGENSVDYALSLNNLAFLYRKMGRAKDAIPLYTRSSEIYAASFGNEHPDYARSLYNLGNAYFAENDLNEAERALLKSVSIRKNSIGINHPRYAENLHSLALLKWKEGLYNESEKYFHELFGNYDHQVSSFFTVLSEQEKAGFFNNKLRTGYEQYNNFAIERSHENPALIGEMYNNQLATKGLILYSTNKVRNSILNSGDSALIKKYNDWISLKEQIAGYYSESKESTAQNIKTADSLNELSNKLEKELNVAYRAGSIVDKKESITWQEIQKSLDKNEGAIEIIRVRQFSPGKGGTYSDSIFYVGLIITSKTKKHPEMVIIRNGLEIEKRYISVYRNSIRFKMDDPFSYNIFWKPFVPYLKGLNRIYISMDGVYNELSLNTLWNPESGKYLLDEFDIHLYTNTRDIIAHKANQPIPSSGNVYLFGFPNYNMGLTKEEVIKGTRKPEKVEEKLDRGLRGMDRSLRGSLRGAIRGGSLLEMLPGTKTEVENIAKIYQDLNQKPVVYTQNAAIESAVKDVVDPKAIHIATHGFFLADLELPETEREDLYAQNPLLRSGLILAGVNNFLTKDVDLDALGGEDGVLTAYEAMNMNLSNTEIVVLSACETGLGTIKNGEGVYGLQRAFQIAGAKSMIMSLWSVDDDATQELMSAFYENWKKTGDKKSAFQKAQMQVKEKYKYPFFWGAFVLIGS